MIGLASDLTFSFSMTDPSLVDPSLVDPSFSSSLIIASLSSPFMMIALRIANSSSFALCYSV